MQQLTAVIRQQHNPILAPCFHRGETENREHPISFPATTNSLSGLSAYSGKLGSLAARAKASDSAGSFSSWLLTATEGPHPECTRNQSAALLVMSSSAFSTASKTRSARRTKAYGLRYAMAGQA